VLARVEAEHKGTLCRLSSFSLQRGTEREFQEGTSWFTFLVTSFLNEKEVTPKTGTDQRATKVAFLWEEFCTAKFFGRG
jgi:hypothetical protein